MAQTLHTPSGMKRRGAYENARNNQNSDLFKDMIRQAFGVDDVICAHHLTYVDVDHHDGFDYQIVQEIASADTLIFDHEAAQIIWGDHWKDILCQLAMRPTKERDELLAKLYQAKTLEGDTFNPAKHF